MNVLVVQKKSHVPLNICTTWFIFIRYWHLYINLAVSFPSIVVPVCLLKSWRREVSVLKRLSSTQGLQSVGSGGESEPETEADSRSVGAGRGRAEAGTAHPEMQPGYETLEWFCEQPEISFFFFVFRRCRKNDSSLFFCTFKLLYLWTEPAFIQL